MMKNIDSGAHTKGASIYLDDIPELSGTLHAACFDATIAHGKIIHLDIEAAEKSHGVVKVIVAKDIPGINQIGGIIPDEPLLADGYVHFCGMPIALVVAETAHQARVALKKIKIEFETLPIITDPRVAAAKGELIVPPRTFKIGASATAFPTCKYVVEGKADINGQEHLYIETQGAYAIPLEHGVIKVYSSTQGPTAVQKAVSKTTGLPMHKVEVDVTRLGGGFGGKEDQANTWAALCAVATHLTKRPVKYALHRMEDMRMTGKRHPYSADFKIGLNADYTIEAYEVTFYQNAGASADLSPAVLERTLFHCTNTYHIPNVTATAYSCRTNLPPNTAFRGFGGPQGVFVIEAAINKVADELGIDAALIQAKNLLETGDEFPYGQKVVSEAKACWTKLHTHFEVEQVKASIDAYNATHQHFKKGMALTPICFGISFTNTMMNQARALVHIYTDGSIAVSTGAVEMGQGVNTKMLQVAATVLSVQPHRITINSTNTYRIANTSPSAASATADLNGKAVQMACITLMERLTALAASTFNVEATSIRIENEQVFVLDKATHLDWNALIQLAYANRISLSEHAHYATPEIHFDKTIEKGHPFAYHVFGTALITVTVDCIRGNYVIDEAKIVHDYGNSMNPHIDKGQIEGGLAQGIGWMTIEEIVYDEMGKLRSNALSTYKVPDIYSVPKTVEILPLETEKDNLAIFRSKAVGEPPLIYGIGAYFAVRNAVKAFNPSIQPPFHTPFTPEKVLLNLYADAAAVLKMKYS